MNQDHIRNFAIIAHIDHGKSTLADRLMEITGTTTKREMQEQLLDSNPIERERGITIKLAPVRMRYQISSEFIVQSSEQNSGLNLSMNHELSTKNEFILNLIDTPGHVDFGYEVSRSLAACEGAILVVDATQGVQAQTLANLHQARQHNLTIIPVINKIDMPHARISETIRELAILGFGEDEVIMISAKTGQNVEKVLEAIVQRIPAPHGAPDAPLRALIFSSQYDTHKGVVVFVRVVDGCLGATLDTGLPAGKAGNQQIKPDQKLRFMVSGADVTPIEIGYFIPRMVVGQTIGTGEVGYIATGLKDVRFAKVGDTVTVPSSSLRVHSHANVPSTMNHELLTVKPLPGYKEPKPMVFLGLFPLNSDEFTQAREAMEKLRLSDSAFTFRPISSLALGNGFHCGFLGLLHAEVVQERLQREFGLSMIATVPSVEYQLRLVSSGSHPSSLAPRSLGEGGLSSNLPISPSPYTSIQSASEFPDPSLVEEVREPIMQLTIFSPKRYVGAIMQLAQEKRAEYIDMKYFFRNSTQPADEAGVPPLNLRGGQEGLSREDDAMVEFTYLIPLSEMIIDFFDRLKSVTEGYASLDYEFFEYQPVDVAKVDILVNKEKVDALSFLVVSDQAERRGREITERLADVIPRQQFEIPIQAAIGGRVIARSDVKAFRKDVIQKLYGGDRTRKDKLLDKQKKGKSKMKMVGRVEIPQTAFFEVLRRT